MADKSKFKVGDPVMALTRQSVVRVDKIDNTCLLDNGQWHFDKDLTKPTPQKETTNEQD